MTEKCASASGNDLLLRLQEAAGCIYMSDLHLQVFHPTVQSAAAAIDAAEYPAEAWNAAMQYITGAAGNGQNAAEAKAQLLARLD